MKKLKLMKLMLTASLVAGAYASAHAAVSAEEAKQLGTTLTPWGAIVAGNKEGTIPAYTGGITTMPPGYVEGKVRPDPFPNDKPQFSIDAKNMDKYLDKLSEGEKLMLKRFPTFRMDIYPTRRSVNYPKHYLDASIRNATKCMAEDGGISLGDGCYNGAPFPIPKTGNEAMWNHLAGRYGGPQNRNSYESVYVDSQGKVVQVSVEKCQQEYPFHDPDRTSVNPKIPYAWMIRNETLGPARVAGERSIGFTPLNYTKTETKYWQYLAGQRRVRLAPDLAYDTPIPFRGGTQTMDDIQMFMGKQDYFDFKIVARKKEMYIPYNTYQFEYFAPTDVVFKANHINPDILRWELHRVTVIEGTLKPGKRHIYHRRVFYQDEDSNAILLADQYDAAGKLYRHGFAICNPYYEAKAPACGDGFGQYDFINGVYAFIGRNGPWGGYTWQAPKLPERDWNPDTLSGSGVR